LGEGSPGVRGKRKESFSEKKKEETKEGRSEKSRESFQIKKGQGKRQKNRRRKKVKERPLAEEAKKETPKIPASSGCFGKCANTCAELKHGWKKKYRHWQGGGKKTNQPHLNKEKSLCGFRGGSRFRLRQQSNSKTQA